MRSLLQELENNEAVLLMYAAGELPADDRVEVEQQLANDAGLRAQLERLRETHDSLTLMLTAADGVAIAAVRKGATEAAREAAAVRRVSRAIVKHQLDTRQADAAARTPEAPLIRLRLPRWTYPFAAAAMIVIAWVAYWGIMGTGPGGRGRLGDGDGVERVARVDEATAAALLNSLDSDLSDRDAIASAGGGEDPEAGDLGALLRAVARETTDRQ